MSAFNNMATKVRDRNWGGTSQTIACEPYVSGYSYIKFIHMPLDLYVPAIQLGVDEEVKTPSATMHVTTPGISNSGASDCRYHLEHAMNSVTPPGGTLNKITLNGLGGLKWSVPGAIDYTARLSIKYYEFSGLPIARIHRAWCNLIRDNRMGLTHMDGSAVDKSYVKDNYAATIAYWTTKPDGKTVEFASIYTGVYPTKDPMDLFSGDITSIDKLEIEVEYALDMIYNDKNAYETCQKFANMIQHGGSNTRWSGGTAVWDAANTGGYATNERNARGGAESAISV